ncbi:MAG: acyl-CoA thioesterase [Bacteroidota bacterium]
MTDKIILKNVTEAAIRFSEVDSMAVVWHGNYVKYIEDGREAFGRQYGLGYLDVYKHGIMTPVVELTMSYKTYLNYGDEIVIETELVDSQAAKIIFKYSIFRKSDRCLVMTARSVQVFVDKQGSLLLTNPEFFLEWKGKLGLNLWES